jgi:tetratricopeptide (TPR) repeat protein
VGYIGFVKDVDVMLIGQLNTVTVTILTLSFLIFVSARARSQDGVFVPCISDAAALLFLISQVLSVHYGIYRQNAKHYAVIAASAINLYFIFRIQGRSIKLLRGFALAALSFGLLLSAVNLPSTAARLVDWKSLFGGSIVPFRAEFFLIGGGTKIDALTMALTIITFCLITLEIETNQYLRSLALLSACASGLVIGAGVSRGVYLGTLALCTVVYLLAKVMSLSITVATRRMLVGLAFAVVIALVASHIPFTKRTTGGERALNSSTRSVEGRVQIWRDNILHMKGRTLWGVGGGNVALYEAGYMHAQAYHPFTSRTYNSVVEVFVQNGLIGALAFCCLVVGTMKACWRGLVDYEEYSNSERLVLAISAAGMIALLVSDLTNASIIRHPPVMCSFMAFAGLINSMQMRSSRLQRHAWTSTAMRPLIGLVILLTLYIGRWGLGEMYAGVLYDNAFVAVQQKNWELALRHIVDAEGVTDCSAPYISMEGLLYERKADEGLPTTEFMSRRGSSSVPDRPDLERAVSAYQRASLCSGMDAMIHNNLGWLYAKLDEDELADKELTKAIEIEPGEGQYHLSRGLLRDKAGDKASADREYAEAIACSPSLLDSYFFYTFSKIRPSESAQVVETSENIVENLEDSPGKSAARGKFAYQDHDIGSAKQQFERILLELPNLPNAWFMLGKIEEEEGNYTQAAIDFRRALFIDPMNRAALARLAIDDEGLKLDEEGLSAAEEALMLEDPSEHAVRSSRIYGTSPLFPNDLLPEGMLPYLGPRIDGDRLCSALYRMAKRKDGGVPDEIVEKIRQFGGSC